MINMAAAERDTYQSDSLKVLHMISVLLPPKVEYVNMAWGALLHPIASISFCVG